MVLFFLGTFVLPIIGLGYSLACELTYPVGEGISCGILMMIASLISTVFTFAITSMIDVGDESSGYLQGKWLVIYTLGGSCVLSLVFALLTRIEIDKNFTKGDILDVRSTSFSIGLSHVHQKD